LAGEARDHNLNGVLVSKTALRILRGEAAARGETLGAWLEALADAIREEQRTGQ
jgi:hypothetical protein